MAAEVGIRKGFVGLALIVSHAKLHWRPKRRRVPDWNIGNDQTDPQGGDRILSHAGGFAGFAAPLPVAAAIGRAGGNLGVGSAWGGTTPDVVALVRRGGLPTAWQRASGHKEIAGGFVIQSSRADPAFSEGGVFDAITAIVGAGERREMLLVPMDNARKWNLSSGLGVGAIWAWAETAAQIESAIRSWFFMIESGG